MERYEKVLTAGWRDMDYNSHMANTAYLDRSADVRMMYFAENGFTAEDMLRMRIGPVIMKDEIEYFREVRLLQEIRVGLALSGLAPDGSRFMLRNEISQLDGTRCAVVTSTGGWLDLNLAQLSNVQGVVLQTGERDSRLTGLQQLDNRSGTIQSQGLRYVTMRSTATTMTVVRRRVKSAPAKTAATSTSKPSGPVR